MLQRKRVLARVCLLLFVLSLLTASNMCPAPAFADDSTPPPTPTCVPDSCTWPDGAGGGRHLGG